MLEQPQSEIASVHRIFTSSMRRRRRGGVSNSRETEIRLVRPRDRMAKLSFCRSRSSSAQRLTVIHSHRLLGCCLLLTLVDSLLSNTVHQAHALHTPVERRSPEFLVEPPSVVSFLNDTGAILTCSAKGSPTPTISWTRADGSVLSSISGLRQIRKDLLSSQLVFQPFGAGAYRQDVHSGTIRCVASNTVGVIQSHDVYIRASVKQPYEVQVYDDFALKGNTGILRCHIPSFVREHVRVTNWLTADDEPVQINSNLLKGGRYSVLPNGELHIHRVSDYIHVRSGTSQSKLSSSTHTSSGASTSAHSTNNNQPSLSFRCQTKHLLSGETKLSSNFGRLIVTEPQSRMPPKIVVGLRTIVAVAGETVELPCSAQAHPWPSFSWFRASVDSTSSALSGVTSMSRLNRLQVAHFRIGGPSGDDTDSDLDGTHLLDSEIDTDDGEMQLATGYRIAQAGRIVQIDSSLFLRDITVADAGLYVCVANNSAGQDRFEIELTVRAPLSVSITPSHILGSDGDTVNLNCSINSGAPISRIQWRRNARPLGASPSLSGSASARVHLFNNDRTLQIKGIRREDRGVFQCIVSNEFESAQASAELSLADDPPAFFSVFSITEPLKPGGALSIKCSATGVPLPQIVWTLDGSPLADHGRVRVGDYVSSDGVVHSFVNITTLRSEDGGIYSCTASNDVHSISHSGRINIYGPAFVRTMKNLTAISGHNIHLHCPAAGYPLESIVWYKKTGGGGRRLPQNHRQKSLMNGTLLIEKVDRSSDEDAYRCVVTGSGGSKASAELNMRVLVAPVISPFNPPPALREGMRVMLTCSVVEGDSPVLIQFLKDGEPIQDGPGPGSRIKLDVTNEFSATLFIASVSAEDSGNYTCIASNMAAVSTYSSVMKVNVPPKWKIAPADTEAIQGQNVVIDCSASGEPRIWWERAFDKPSDNRLSVSQSFTSDHGHNNPTSGHFFRTLVSNSHMHTLENGSLMIRDVSEEDSGVYLCQANNGVGSGLSKVITLKVHVPAQFKSKFAAQTTQKGDSVEFACESNGEAPLNILLSKDRMPLDIEQPEVASGKSVELTLRTDARYRFVWTKRPDGLVLSVRVSNVDRRDSSLFTCFAANSFGKDEYNFQLIVQEPPSKPENIHVLESDSRSSVIGWATPYSGNSPLLAYHVEYRQHVPNVDAPWAEMSNTGSGSGNGKHLEVSSSPNGAVFRETISGNENSFAVRGLRPMAAYDFRLQAENKLGLGQFSQVLKFTTKEEAPSGPPQNIHVYPLTARSLQVTFQPPRAEHQNGQLLGYYVGYKALEQDEHFMFKKVPESQTTTLSEVFGLGKQAQSAKEVRINDLRRATKYVIIVQAFNRVGPGPQSEEIVGETLVNDPPRAPVLNSVNVDYDSVELSWRVETQDSLLGKNEVTRAAAETPEITGYFIYAKSPSGEWEERQIDAAQTSFTFTQLLCGTQYQFYVIAYNNIGKGDPSQAIAVRTKGSAPLAPKSWSSFISVNATAALIRLDAWLVNGCEIKYFVVKYRPRTESDWLVASAQIYPQQRFVELVDLKPASWYLLNMAAVTDTGTTEETYMFSTLTTSGETLPPLDTISRTLTSATTAAAGLGSMQSLTILIPATCSVIVLTVIIVVACYVLNTKRGALPAHFEGTIMSVMNGGCNGGGGPGSTTATPGHGAATPHSCHVGGGMMGGTPLHHSGTPINSGSSEGEPRYGTISGGVTLSGTTTYEHYGYSGGPLSGTNFDTNSFTHHQFGGQLPPSLPLPPPTSNGAGPTQLSGPLCPPPQLTTCLDAKLVDIPLNGPDSKGITDINNLQPPNHGTLSNNNNNNNNNEENNYFQTPYALSRIIKPPPPLPNGGHEEVPSNPDLLHAQCHLQPQPTCTGCGATQTQTATQTLGRNLQRRPDGNLYDMPFPPKWV